MTTMPAGVDTNADTKDEVDPLSTINTFSPPLDEDERRLISPVLLLLRTCPVLLTYPVLLLLRICPVLLTYPVLLLFPALLLIGLGVALEDTCC